MKFEEIEPFTKEEILEIIAWNDPNRLHLVPVALGLYSDDLQWAIGKCIDLASHSDPIVRGNSLLSFGHFARRFHSAHKRLVEPLIQKGLSDSNEYVRSHAQDAADDIDHFCTWKVNRNPKKKLG